MVYAILLVVFIAALYVWLHIRGLDLIAERKAIKELERILFPAGHTQRSTVIDAIHRMTNQRLSDDEALDYFLKIKGLQVINLHDPIDYWTRKYLMASTKTKLNYFEQVRFYEEFLNYPESNKRAFSKTNDSPLANYPLTQAAQDLLKNAALAKMLA